MSYDPLKYFNTMGPNDKLKHVGVDLDGCLAESIWPDPGIGAPIKKTVDFVKHLTQKGYKIIIFTSRASAEYKDIKSWLEDHNIPFVWILTGKPLMAAYIDDKNFNLPWLEEPTL